jgi:predicted Fe-S protein YdhL (DUF1289 family)
MSFVEAREKWAAMSQNERKELIEKVRGDIAEAVNDWAALPPQAHTAIMAVLFPADDAASEDEPHAKRRGR